MPDMKSTLQKKLSGWISVEDIHASVRRLEAFRKRKEKKEKLAEEKKAADRHKKRRIAHTLDAAAYYDAITLNKPTGDKE